MLKIGQKVRVRPDCNRWHKGVVIGLSKAAGKITVITGYAGNYISVRSKKPEDFYYIALSDIPTSRYALQPIDDEPCDEEFFREYFKEYESNNCG